MFRALMSFKVDLVEFMSQIGFICMIGLTGKCRCIYYV